MNKRTNNKTLAWLALAAALAALVQLAGADTYYDARNPNLPPLPFNPRPDKWPVTTLSNGTYMYYPAGTTAPWNAVIKQGDQPVAKGSTLLSAQTMETTTDTEGPPIPGPEPTPEECGAVNIYQVQLQTLQHGLRPLWGEGQPGIATNPAYAQQPQPGAGVTVTMPIQYLRYMYQANQLRLPNTNGCLVDHTLTATYHINATNGLVDEMDVSFDPPPCNGDNPNLLSYTGTWQEYMYIYDPLPEGWTWYFSPTEVSLEGLNESFVKWTVSEPNYFIDAWKIALNEFTNASTANVPSRFRRIINMTGNEYPIGIAGTGTNLVWRKAGDAEWTQATQVNDQIVSVTNIAACQYCYDWPDYETAMSFFFDADVQGAIQLLRSELGGECDGAIDHSFSPNLFYLDYYVDVFFSTPASPTERYSLLPVLYKPGSGVWEDSWGEEHGVANYCKLEVTGIPHFDRFIATPDGTNGVVPSVFKILCKHSWTNEYGEPFDYHVWTNFSDTVRIHLDDEIYIGFPGWTNDLHTYDEQLAQRYWWHSFDVLKSSLHGKYKNGGCYSTNQTARLPSAACAARYGFGSGVMGDYAAHCPCDTNSTASPFLRLLSSDAYNIGNYHPPLDWIEQMERKDPIIYSPNPPTIIPPLTPPGNYLNAMPLWFNAGSDHRRILLATVESSPDLSSWSTHTNGYTGTNGCIHFTVLFPTNTAQIFFRAFVTETNTP